MYYYNFWASFFFASLGNPSTESIQKRYNQNEKLTELVSFTAVCIAVLVYDEKGNSSEQSSTLWTKWPNTRKGYGHPRSM